MPQEVRTQIYHQVLREFRKEARKQNRMRRRHLFFRCRALFYALLELFKKIFPYLLVLLALFVAVSGIGWVIRQLPAVFDAIGDFFADIFDGPLEFIGDLLPEKSEEAAATMPKEKDPFTFRKLLQAIKNFFGWIWDALIWIWDALVWIFNLLKKLWKAFVWLVKLIAGLAVIVFALIVEIFKLLFKVIKFLISLL